MKHHLLTVASLVLACAASTSHAYQIELGANTNYIKPENSGSGYGFGVSGTYYLKNVRALNNKPYAELAFLNKASNISTQASWNDLGDSELNTYSFSGEYFVPNSLFVVNGKISRNNADNNTTLYGAELGYMPLNNLLLAIGATGYKSGGIDGVDPSIRAKYLTQYAGRDLNLEGSMAFGDLDEYKLTADYYLDKSLSLGADYYQDKISGHKIFGLKGEKFFNPNMSLGGHVGFGSSNDLDYTRLGLSGKYRF